MSIDRETLLGLYRTMLTIRIFEQRVARDLADKILQRLALSAGSWT